MSSKRFRAGRRLAADEQAGHCPGTFATRHFFGRHGLEDERPGLGVLQDEIDLVRLGAPVDRHDDDAGKLAGPVQGRRLPAVLQNRDQTIAAFEAETSSKAATTLEMVLNQSR